MGREQRTLIYDTLKKIGQSVHLFGWVHSVRDHGKITFVDLRDGTGIVQCVSENLTKLTAESVVEVVGEVKSRPENLINPKLPTGKIEVLINKLNIISKSNEQLPFPLDTDGSEIDEEVRLKYRYLDLRRERLQKNIKLRSLYIKAAREYLYSQKFIEIETPLLSQTTPEGSRDFLVPSRIYKGMFYALPQSPQQYKQLLMTAGFERYFQIARCIRDEDPRSDRAFEHTQIDLEASFVNREDVMKVVEEMTIKAVEAVGSKISKKPFPVFTYQEAMSKFGSDKFDLRTDREKKEGILSFAWVVDFPFFKKDSEGNWTFTHNPFSAPKDEKNETLLLGREKIGEILTSQYDLVGNGHEVSGGSIRTHKPQVLYKTFEIMGLDKKDIENQFGHMLTAFSYGTPPHGGCAQGVERILMTILGEEYIREVQAFPMTGRGRTSIMNAPNKASLAQLKELGLKTTSPEKN